jgi:tRNA(adenine34) deaminase
VTHNSDHSDIVFMREALRLAEQAAELGEVPVGAILVRKGQVIGRGFNQPVSSHDPTAHAEIRALRDAGQVVSNYRLPDTTLYVTIEPCTMCLGALIHARVGRIVFGAPEPRYGAVVSGQRLLENGQFNHRPQVQSGVLEAECAGIMKQFFAAKRKQAAQAPQQ